MRGLRPLTSHLLSAGVLRRFFPHKPINREPTTDTFRILLTKCVVASRRLAARSSVIHPTTAARLRRPDRTSGRPSAGGSPSGGYSPLHCCPPPASRPQPRPSCHYLPSCSTASRNLAHSPARYSALSPFPSLVSSIGSPTYSLSLFPNSL